MISFKVDNLKNMGANVKTFVDFLRLSGADDEDIFASKLVTCELITNVIRHGGDEAEFTGTLSGDTITIRSRLKASRGWTLPAPRPTCLPKAGGGCILLEVFAAVSSAATAAK